MDLIHILGWLFVVIFFLTNFFWFYTVIIAVEAYFAVFPRKPAIKMSLRYIFASLLSYISTCRGGLFFILHPIEAENARKVLLEELEKAKVK